MLINNICAYIALVSLSALIAFVVINLIHKYLYDLVKELVKLSSAAIFYVRALAICLVSLSLANVIGSKFNLKQNAHFMEYVFGIANDLEEVFRHIGLFLLGYLFLITLLVVVLKHKHD